VQTTAETRAAERKSKFVMLAIGVVVLVALLIQHARAAYGLLCVEPIAAALGLLDPVVASELSMMKSTAIAGGFTASVTFIIAGVLGMVIGETVRVVFGRDRDARYRELVARLEKLERQPGTPSSGSQC
jgi:hypothetical protein